MARSTRVAAISGMQLLCSQLGHFMKTCTQQENILTFYSRWGADRVVGSPLNVCGTASKQVAASRPLLKHFAASALTKSGTPKVPFCDN